MGAELELENKETISRFTRLYLFFWNWLVNHPMQAFSYCVIIAGMIYRIHLALNIEGLLHPDELFQSIEMAHLLVFDSGIKPFEFQTSGTTEASYAASRSWVFPGIFALIMKFGDLIGLDYFDQTLPLIRLFLAINSTFLVIASTKLVRQMTKNDLAAIFTTVSLSFWFRLVEYTIRSFNNTFFLPILIYAIYRVLLALERDNFTIYDHFIVIIGMGVSSYNRLDLSLIIFGFFLVTFSFTNLREYLELALDVVLGFILCLRIDAYYYESVKYVPYNWFRFNIIEHNSDNFGTTGWTYYIRHLIIEDGLLVFLIGNALILGLLIIFRLKNQVNFHKNHKKLVKSFYQFAFITILIWGVYSNFWRGLTLDKFWEFILSGNNWDPQTHKEKRFMIGGLAILLMFFSIGFSLLVEFIVNVIEQNDIKLPQITYQGRILFTREKFTRILLTTLIIAIIIIQSFALSQDRFDKPDYADIIEGMEYVGRQDDVKGLVVGLLWYQSGGYAYSHLPANVDIQFVDFGSDDPINVERNIRRVNLYLSNGEYNYFVTPWFQFNNYGNLSIILVENYWMRVDEVMGTTQVWKQMSV